MPTHPTLSHTDQQKLLNLILEVCELENEDLHLDEATSIRDLPGVDSVTVFQLLGKIEIEFFINLGFESIKQVETVSDLFSVVARAQHQPS